MFLSYIVFHLKINCSKKKQTVEEKNMEKPCQNKSRKIIFAKLKNIHVFFEAMFAYRNTENKIRVGLH